MVEYIELAEPLEKPRAKKALSEIQLKNLEKGRERKKEIQNQNQDEKLSKKMEDRFDKLLMMIEKVSLPTPEVQEAIKAKRVKVRPESEEELEKPKARVIAKPQTKEFFLRFC